MPQWTFGSARGRRETPVHSGGSDFFRTGEPDRFASRPCARTWTGLRATRLCRHLLSVEPRRRRDLDRTGKREFVSSLAAVFAETSMVVVTRNDGLTVAQVTVLRSRMRAAGATFKVAKNRLAILALDGTRFDSIAPLLKGPTALAWAHDPVAVAKVAVEFAKTNDKLVILGGALGAQTLNADGIKALAELPSLDVLRAQLVGLISTPATRIAGILQAPAAQLARVFGAYANKDEEVAETVEAA
ncbi:MAG: 50S ribosomal protein L10 [Janthinobacterium lividum]